MNALLLLLAFIIASFAILVKAEKIRQCTCQEQHKCIEALNAEGASCVKECEESANVKATVNNTANIGKCMEMGTKVMYDYNNCMGQQLTDKQSCAKDGAKEQQIESTDFIGILSQNMEQLGGKLIQFYQAIAKSQKTENALLNALIEMDKCGQECGKKKMQNFNCFEEAKCGLKVTDQLITQVIGQCAHNLDLQKQMLDTCHCFSTNVDKTLEPFCEQLGKTKLPKEF